VQCFEFLAFCPLPSGRVYNKAIPRTGGWLITENVRLQTYALFEAAAKSALHLGAGVIFLRHVPTWTF
jgi:hypothetical protein